MSFELIPKQEVMNNDSEVVKREAMLADEKARLEAIKTPANQAVLESLRIISNFAKNHLRGNEELNKGKIVDERV